MSETNEIKDWQLHRSPAERIGLDKLIYREGKKVDLFTNTKNYVTERNKLFNDLTSGIQTTYDNIMNKLKDSGVPYAERDRIAMKASNDKKNEMINIIDELFPMADSAYKQVSNLSKAQNVVDGNIMGSTTSKPKKKRAGRPAGAKNKKKSAKNKSTKKGKK